MARQSQSPQSRDIRTKQPNSKHCFVCGIENVNGLGLRFYETEGGKVEVEYSIPEHFQGYPGVAHGGIIASILDEAAARAAMVDDHNRFWVTAKTELRYRKPVPIGVSISILGKLIRKRGKFALTHAALYLNDGTLAADAEILLSDLPEVSLDAEELAALGWKVYPD